MSNVKSQIKVMIAVLFFAPFCVFAQEEAAPETPERAGIVIEPYIVDEKLKARDIRDYKIRIFNNSGRRVSLYPIVSDVDPLSGRILARDIYELDKDSSLTRWIEFTRGVIVLQAGESAEHDLKIKAAIKAAPGKYFAAISFPHGSHRPDAEARLAAAEQPHLLINVEIADESVEQARVKSFNSDHNVYLDLPARFRIEVENSGNIPVVPAGFIYLYDRRGAEAAQLTVNAEARAVDADASTLFTVEWPGENKLGKYQAKLELTYGHQNSRDIQSALFFWTLPWPLLSLVLGFLFLIVFLLTWFLFRRTWKHHHQLHHPGDPEETDGVLDLRGKK